MRPGTLRDLGKYISDPTEDTLGRRGMRVTVRSEGVGGAWTRAQVVDIDEAQEEGDWEPAAAAAVDLNGSHSS
jgi:hypothetical protein